MLFSSQRWRAFVNWFQVVNSTSRGLSGPIRRFRGNPRRRTRSRRLRSNRLSVTDWLRDTGRSFERLSSASSFKRALWRATTAPNLRHLGFEPLEQRQLLTALGFAATPFGVDSSTKNLQVNYTLDATTSAPFDIQLEAIDTSGISHTLMTGTVPTNQAMGTYSFSFTGNLQNDLPSDYALQVELDPSHVIGPAVAPGLTHQNWRVLARAASS
jgi:hypothetical protein